jgi:hypothetical protein
MSVLYTQRADVHLAGLTQSARTLYEDGQDDESFRTDVAAQLVVEQDNAGRKEAQRVSRRETSERKTRETHSSVGFAMFE